MTLYMKKKIIFCSILTYAFITFSFTSKCQVKDTIINSDTLNLVHFDLCPNDYNYWALNTALLNRSSFLLKFGNPIKKSIRYSKIKKANLYHFVYKGAEVWYKNDTLESIIFTNSNYKFVLSNGNTIKVGDSISSLQKLFQHSWKERESYLKNQVYVGLLNSSGPIDAGLVFEFNPSTGLVKTIALFK